MTGPAADGSSRRRVQPPTVETERERQRERTPRTATLRLWSRRRQQPPAAASTRTTQTPPRPTIKTAYTNKPTTSRQNSGHKTSCGTRVVPHEAQGYTLPLPLILPLCLSLRLSLSVYLPLSLCLLFSLLCTINVCLALTAPCACPEYGVRKCSSEGCKGGTQTGGWTCTCVGKMAKSCASNPGCTAKVV